METDYAANVMHVFRRATDSDIREGMGWYESAREIAREADTLVKGAGIIAALSPRMPWDRNVALARQAFAGPLTSGALGQSLAKVALIQDGVHPIAALGKGLKTQSFFANILDPSNPHVVTVDTHAIKIAGLNRDSVTPRMYADIAAGYMEAAAYASILPQQMQAITWTTYRRETIPDRIAA